MRNKKKIQRWWKVPRSFKCANTRCSVGTATGQATYLLADPYDDTKESSRGKHPGNQPSDGINSKNNTVYEKRKKRKRTGLNSKISVR